MGSWHHSPSGTKNVDVWYPFFEEVICCFQLWKFTDYTGVIVWKISYTFEFVLLPVQWIHWGKLSVFVKHLLNNHRAVLQKPPISSEPGIRVVKTAHSFWPVNRGQKDRLTGWLTVLINPCNGLYEVWKNVWKRLKNNIELTVIYNIRFGAYNKQTT